MDETIVVGLIAVSGVIIGALIAFLASWLTARETNKAAARLERVQSLRQQREKRITKLRELLIELADTVGAAITAGGVLLELSQEPSEPRKLEPYPEDLKVYKQVGAMMAHVPPGSVATAWQELSDYLERWMSFGVEEQVHDIGEALGEVTEFIARVNDVHEAIDEFVVGKG